MRIQKVISSVFICLLISIFLFGCGKSQNQLNTSNANENNSESNINTEFAEDKLVNPFKDVLFVCSGWDGFGKLNFETDKCNQFIKDNITFQLEGCINGELSNGSIVTVRAIYDLEKIKNQNYSIEFDTMPVEISGLTELVSASNYSEDKAWIQYTKEEYSFLACIDKTGKILFQFNNGLDLQANLFSNGYAHITKNDGTMYVIDTDGVVKSKYSSVTTGEVLAYGDGYTFTKQYVSDFDAAYDLFSIYDYNGTLIEEFTLTSGGSPQTDKLRSVYYCGDGVFELDTRFNGATFFYFVESNTWKYDIQAMLNCRFDKGVAFVDLQADEWEGHAPRGQIVLLEKTGQVKRIALPKIEYFDWQWSQKCYISDAACMLWSDAEPYIMTCNVTTGEFASLDDYYLKKIDWDALWENMGYVDGHIAIPLKGSDKKTYITLFDKELKALTDPIEYKEIIGFSDDRLILRQSSGVNIYDGLGNLIFSLSEKNIKSIAPYSNEVAHTAYFYYVDLNGNILFENIFTDGIEASALDTIS